MSPRRPQAYRIKADGDIHRPFSYKTPMKHPGGAAGSTDENS
ncbi:hypothetical protein ASZ90_008867 [hydrocarbon metagenome]|uniref:Uncharacterized protein n=1 Tax=hydrocarbon metagenome TaxID=938273 RepID=A0A0W8FL73_9ZZZZ